LSDDGATPRVDSTIIRVPGLPGRNHLPTLEGRGDVSLALYRQTRPAPLLFILAGLGSNPYFGSRRISRVSSIEKVSMW